MALVKHYDTPDRADKPPCVYLRSKAMYVTGELRTPEHPDEEADEQCWCNMTQHVIGPDDLSVDRLACVAGRTCFRATRD